MVQERFECDEKEIGSKMRKNNDNCERGRGGISNLEKVTGRKEEEKEEEL